MTLKRPCKADGIRHAHVEAIEAVPYVIPALSNPPVIGQQSPNQHARFTHSD